MKENCPRFEKAIDLISKRWNCLIVYHLLNGPSRFCELEAQVGISGKMLSERLKVLEENEIIIRNVYPDTPVRIEYTLTEKGKSLESVLHHIEAWSKNWI